MPVAGYTYTPKSVSGAVTPSGQNRFIPVAVALLQPCQAPPAPPEPPAAMRRWHTTRRHRSCRSWPRVARRSRQRAPRPVNTYMHTSVLNPPARLLGTVHGRGREARTPDAATPHSGRLSHTLLTLSLMSSSVGPGVADTRPKNVLKDLPSRAELNSSRHSQRWAVGDKRSRQGGTVSSVPCYLSRATQEQHTHSSNRCATRRSTTGPTPINSLPRLTRRQPRAEQPHPHRL